MLIGEYNYAVDEKGRLNFPARFRDEMGESFTVARWLDNSLVAFPQEKWEIMAGRLLEKGFTKARDAQLYLFASAAPAQPDKQGRILLPPQLREYAGLEKEVTILGVGDHAEIWNTDAWRKRSASMTAAGFASALEELEL
ncbi:MAG: division/cell wall cluster transcriptional repressor MraZ [Ruthenibacterium sp.]